MYVIAESVVFANPVGFSESAHQESMYVFVARDVERRKFDAEVKSASVSIVWTVADNVRLSVVIPLVPIPPATVRAPVVVLVLAVVPSIFKWRAIASDVALVEPEATIVFMFGVTGTYDAAIVRIVE